MDKNIDHRRVPNLRCYFERQGFAVKKLVTDRISNRVIW